LVWGEILTCGRKLNNEVFSFSTYHSITHIYVNEKLAIRENLLMKPSTINPYSIGQLEGFTHQAGMILRSHQFKQSSLKEIIYEFLSKDNKIRFGVSTAPENAIIIRILGNGAEHLFSLLNNIRHLYDSMIESAIKKIKQ
jgi:urease accessory protein